MREDLDVTEMTDDQLRKHAQGCTEFTCLYHGRFNIELYERKATR